MAENSAPPPPRRVLVVEDDPVVRGLFASVLREEGYAVDEAGDGETALEVFRAARPDVVLLDLALPGMNGMDVLVAMDPRRTGTAVVAVSGIPFAEASEPYLLAKTLGARRFMAKPVGAAEVLAVVKELSGG